MDSAAVAWLIEEADVASTKKSDDDVTEVEFITDSGCTRFMMRDKEYFSSCSELVQPVPISLANNSSASGTHSGTIELVSNVGCDLSLTEVLFVPGLRRNLLSVRKIASRGYDVVFKKDLVEIRKGDAVLATGYVRDELYHMKFVLRKASATVSETGTSFELLHR